MKNIDQSAVAVTKTAGGLLWSCRRCGAVITQTRGQGGSLNIQLHPDEKAVCFECVAVILGAVGEDSIDAIVDFTAGSLLK